MKMNECTLLPKDLINKNEKKYFWIVLIISILSYIGFALSIFGILILLSISIISFFLHALMIGNIRANAVKLSPMQFPKVYETAQELCAKMGISKVPDIYVMQSGGVLNAFATRFFGRNMVVIYAEIFELINTNNDDELNFILAHELAHIKRNHLSKLMFILPAMWIPGIAELYLRACEYTCDRYAAFYTGNNEASKNSLIMLAVGKNLYLHVNRAEYIEQLNHEKGFFVWLSELLSTHPPLPKRVNEISHLFGETEQELTLLKNSKSGWFFGIVSIVSLLVLSVGFYYLVREGILYDPLEEFEEVAEAEEEIPSFIVAVANDDFNKVNQLIEKGEDLNQEDFNDNTALDWAVKGGNPKMVELLLNSGADSNYESSYGMTSLMTAGEIGDPNMVKILVEGGGDPNYQEYNGMTALFYAVYSSNLETVKVLLDLGADPNIKDSQGMTVHMLAVQSGEREIAGFLKEYKK
ncbi:M48 family metallopeptidase [Psychrobacillus sp. L3]|uniref:M48 family metallopeptidase n=1 Tax=Psychrobacillus sp. L3 TaxID=3236891 RepID=UPI0036F3A8B4